MTEIKDVSQLEALIKDAFSGVTLGKGVSMGQSVVLDRWGRDDSGRLLTEREFKALKQHENTYNWQTLTKADLGFGIAYLDAAGFRYYIPAYIVSALHGSYVADTIYYLSASRVNSQALRASLLDDRQRYAIAQFLYWLPYNFDFGSGTWRVNAEIEAALQIYWVQYLNLEAGD